MCWMCCHLMRLLQLLEWPKSCSGKLILRSVLHPRLRQQRQTVLSMFQCCLRVPHWSLSSCVTKSWIVSFLTISVWSPYSVTTKNGANVTSPGQSSFFGAKCLKQAAFFRVTAMTLLLLLCHHDLLLLPLCRSHPNASSPTSSFPSCKPPQLSGAGAQETKRLLHHR